MPAQPQITPTDDKTWTNRHNTFTQPIDNLFDIANGDTGNAVNDYNATTAAIQSLIGRAIAENKTIRALGGGWSFSKVAATDGWIVNTKQLNMLFNIRNPQSISPQYTGNHDQLLFAQCGNSVQELNDWLKKNNRSLKTSGASNGQTIVGLFSTGSHGSAIDFGSAPDFVVGLHIIVSPGKHIWLEKASYPVVTKTFTDRLQAELVQDDELFNAAVVSFGSFGFIHGAMIETEEIYLLECYRQKIPIDDSLKHMMETLDFSNAHFVPHGNERPFHFQVVINQYDLQGGAYTTIMYKRPYTNSYTPPVVDFDKAGPGDDVPAFLGKVTDLLPVVTPIMVSQLVKQSYALYTGVLGTSGEIFTNNNIRGRVVSTAMGIPANRANEVNDMLITLNDAHGPFTGIFSYRYVKGSKATFAFTKFDPTCILELDGVESTITRNFYELVWNELEARNIPYTFHWGKINDLDEAKLKKMYPGDFDQWIQARNKILPPSSLKVFNSPTLSDWGLDKVFP
jgi:hypothetical protein